jgi:hypothetical protein
MTTYISFNSDGRTGMTMNLAIVEKTSFEQFVEEAFKTSPAEAGKQYGFSKTVYKVFREAIVFPFGSEIQMLKHNDAYQYDKDDNVLLANGVAYEGGREIELPDKGLTEEQRHLKRLIETTFVQFSEVLDHWNSPERKALHDAKTGIKQERKAMATLRETTQMLVARLMLNSIQEILRRQLRVLVPIMLQGESGKSAKMVVEGTLLDPEALTDEYTLLGQTLMNNMTKTET